MKENLTDDETTELYESLRKIAKFVFAGERPGHTLQPTALVHESYLRLVKKGWTKRWKKEQILSFAAQQMRQILVDHARKRNALKRGGEVMVTCLEDLELDVGDRSQDPVRLLELHTALERLSELSTRQAKVVELRYFGGLSIEETGRVLGVSIATVKGDWALARSWLYGQLRTIEDGKSGQQ